MATIHISAAPGDFADVVLMPGDPLRARYIAERFLEQPREVTAVRNMLGFTGQYQGQRVSVMGHGMGIPSVSIYATELIRHYGVRVLIRVGSCGALRPEVDLKDVIVALAAGTDSRVNRHRFLDHDFPAVADFDLARKAMEFAARRGQAVRAGSVFSSDLFYTPDAALLHATLVRMGMLAIEMEVAGLYGVAAEEGARALALLSVADNLPAGTALSSAERETSFDAMIGLALELAAAEAAALAPR
ncbi:purine-nucleoside phosphorylase [Polyangium fumosum]|uniref:Uridine phosphorylase n=1 Tax=Polyangium fumosum TaxID=889272 RepID=A0A4U1JGB7_9BACT|nr:purine-nucleoside phosphorylase [Polyangium fumosum]TKD10136.1 purine-nucleoside phosphorylase [Polyangium fumosum]